MPLLLPANFTPPPTMPSAIAGMNVWLAKGALPWGCPQTIQYTGIGYITGDIAGLGGSTKMADITPHGPATQFSYDFPTLRTWGPVTFDLNYVPGLEGDAYAGGISGLMQDWAQGLQREFAVVWPDGTIDYWTAYVSKCEVKAATTAVCTAAVTLASFGPPTFSA